MELFNTPQVPANHAPISLSKYLEIHATVLEQFKHEGFVGNDNLELNRPSQWQFTMHGELSCLGGIVIETMKNIRVIENSSDPIIQTAKYSYNAFIRNSGNILRYDNAHSHPGHRDMHHKHTYNWQSNVEDQSSPTWIGVDNWLTFGDVIAELRDWYWENYSALSKPNSYPAIGLR